jgi:hypothetical protein
MFEDWEVERSKESLRKQILALRPDWARRLRMNKTGIDMLCYSITVVGLGTYFWGDPETKAEWVLEELSACEKHLIEDPPLG